MCAARLRERLFSPPGGPIDATADGFWRHTLDPRSRPDGPLYNLLLVLGFRAYYHALTDEDPERRSRSILLGNCLIGLHEQRLLARAISAGFRSWLRTLTAPWRLLQPRAAWLAHRPADRQLRLENRWIHLATRALIGVRLPWGMVRIGSPVPSGERPVSVPPVRAPIDARPVRSLTDDELLAQAWERFEVTGGPARCWNDLHDRVGYIMAVFARQQRSIGWFGPDGQILRPEPGPGFNQDLARLTGDLNRRPPAPIPPDTVDPGWEELLDRLRAEPSFIPLDADALAVLTLDQSELTAADRRRFYAGLSADVNLRLAAAAVPGGLLSPDICRQARAVFRRWSTVWFMGLLFRSLPDSYAAAAGVHVLGEVSELATDPFRRCGETAQFIVDLLGRDDGWGPDGLIPEGDAYRSVVGIRAMHAIVAHHLLAAGWDSARYGLPLNAEDVLGTALTFGVSPVEMLDQLGFDVPQAQREAWVRFWLGIGHLLGAPLGTVTTSGPAGPVPLTYPQARDLARFIRSRHHARSLDGVRLGEAIVAGTADGFPRGLGWLAAGLMQVLGDPRVVELLLLRAGSRREAALVIRGFSLLLGTRATRPAGRVLVRTIGAFWVRPFLRQGRTRPYRRPLRPGDRARLAWSRRVALAWPLSCAPPVRPAAGT